MIARILMAVLLAFSAASAWAQSAVDGTWDFAMASQMGSVAAKVTMKVEGEMQVIGAASAMGSVVEWSMTRDAPESI